MSRPLTLAEVQRELDRLDLQGRPYMPRRIVPLGWPVLFWICAPWALGTLALWLWRSSL